MDEDMKWHDEHHQRQMMLMREMGKVNRMETRMYMLWAVVAVLIVLALLAIGLLVWRAGYPRETTAVVVFVSLAKAASGLGRETV